MNADVKIVVDNLGVSEEIAIQMIKEGINVDYLRGGLKSIIEQESTDLINTQLNNMRKAIDDEFKSAT